MINSTETIIFSTIFLLGLILSGCESIPEYRCTDKTLVARAEFILKCVQSDGDLPTLSSCTETSEEVFCIKMEKKGNNENEY